MLCAALTHFFFSATNNTDLLKYGNIVGGNSGLDPSGKLQEWLSPLSEGSKRQWGLLRREETQTKDFLICHSSNWPVGCTFSV